MDRIKVLFVEFKWILILVLCLGVSGRNRYKKYIEPNFVKEPNNITIHRGQTAVLKCTVENLGPKTVVWRKKSDSYVLSIGDRMYADIEEMSVDVFKFPKYDRIQTDLIIKHTQPSHSGLYECQISSKKGYNFIVQLNVLDTQPAYEPALTINGTVYVSKFSKISLTCNATGAVRAPEDIDWFHKGQKIRQNDPHWRHRTLIYKYQEVPGRSLVSNLTVERAREEDAGTYICRSSDKDTKSINVHVLNAGRDIYKREDDNGIASKHDHQTLENSSSRCRLLYVTMFLVTLVLVVNR
ncbi:MAM domain-containing glycosylphosphatidylinositol anchor protein 1-like [Saccostrea echinata]|uniref:MAM domain-containing glycosylphosphatidylinositol anchor protein 1-like n=1 Tax=Saccostrea echinata TaxID=191078 RepID=UPI002A800B07|nr:MAM domain-containing glycosylphosphatidylinositol anchor protein 1-like [Saccostrea echinata]XP_061192014.1 MAM domain-containing glycosylphosphatidylinositol anchor protein 1-like [Saccostrea echinata]